MKYYFLCLLLFIVSDSCRNRSDIPQRSLVIPENKTIFLDECELTDLAQFIKQNPRTMLAFYQADCSMCTIGINNWLEFQKKYPGIRLLLIATTKQNRKRFWATLTHYYNQQFYVVFDSTQSIFKHNNFQHETVIVDSMGKIILEYPITDKKFAKKYMRSIK